jgi:hypothetical protein
MTDHSRHVKHLRPQILQLKRREGGWAVTDGRTGEPLLPTVSSLKSVKGWMALMAEREGAIIDYHQVERELERASREAVRWARQPKAPDNVIPFPLERRR